MAGVTAAGRRWLTMCCAAIAVVAAGCTSASSSAGTAPATGSSVQSSALLSSAIPSAQTPTAALSTPELSIPDPATSAPSSVQLSTPAPSTAPPPTSTPSTPQLSTPQSTLLPPTTAATAADLPAVDLAGVNVTGCRTVYRPVVLLHGSFSTVGSNFSALVPMLRAGGRCVYGVNYGNGGIAAVSSSAGEAAGLVAAVLAGTGADAVDVVAYSQGGLVLRTALRLNGLATEVATAVLIAPSWNGTTSRAAAVAPAALCPACADQVAHSALLQRLDAGGDLDGSVRYAEISTRADIVVTPVSSQVPAGPADRVRSVVVETVCPALVTDHIQLPAVPGVIAWTMAALQNDGRPPTTALTC